MLIWLLIPSDARLWQLTCKYLCAFLLFTVIETILYRHSNDIWYQAKRFCSFSRDVRKECSSNTRIVDKEYRLLESRDPGTATYPLYLPKKTLRRNLFTDVCGEMERARSAKKGLTNLTTPPLCVSGQEVSSLPSSWTSSLTRDLDKSRLEVPALRFLFS